MYVMRILISYVKLDHTLYLINYGSYIKFVITHNSYFV